MWEVKLLSTTMERKTDLFSKMKLVSVFEYRYTRQIGLSKLFFKPIVSNIVLVGIDRSSDVCLTAAFHIHLGLFTVFS